MSSYAELKGFMDRAIEVNDHFERFKNSSLHELIEALKADPMDKRRVLRELGKIPQGKVLKYSNSMQHLLATFPGMHSGMLPWGALKETNAAKFPKTVVPSTYNPRNNQGKEIVVGQPPTGFLNQTCEMFLLNSLEANGIVLIHLCKHQDAMNNTYNGKKVVEHINSVLRVAKVTSTPVCSLYMTQDTPVCRELKDAYDDVPERVAVFRREGHMGSAVRAFREFAQSKKNCVVMGFDGTICVHANIFGSPEFCDDDQDAPAPPLITLTSVITSRAVLVNDGVLYSKGSTAKPYGVLDLT